MEKKRKSVDLRTKLEIINICETSNISKSKIGRRYGLSSSTLFTILKNKDVIKSAVLRDNTSVKMKKLRGAQHSDLEKVLFKWFCENRLANNPISGPLLKAKADELSTQMNLTHFKCSDGWLNRFKARKGITFRHSVGENTYVQEVADWSLHLLDILKHYKVHDIYNVTETALFYNLTPDQTLEAMGDNCHEGERSNQRLTVLLCANMSGNCKINPFVIGKSSAHTFRHMKNMPCVYEADPKAWITPSLFNQWLQTLDTKIGHQNRKIVLFLTKSSVHSVVTLNNIQLEFFPSHYPEILQPLNPGVIRQLKHNYRTILLENLARNSRLGKWSLLDAIKTLGKSWEHISPKQITLGFKRAGFGLEQYTVKDENVDIEEPIGWNTVAERLGVTTTYQDYVSVDDNISISNEQSNGLVLTKFEENFNQDYNDKINENEMEIEPTELEVTKALEVIDVFYRLSQATSKDLVAFRQVEKFVKCEIDKRR